MSIKLRRNLRQWALKNNISHSALNDLLQALSLCGIRDLPNDDRSLVKTPRNIPSVETMGRGQYWHNGLGNCLKEMLIDLNQPCVVKLNFHVDGLPINKSSKHQFWPILTNIANMPHIWPLPIAIFYGEAKPPSADIFLKKFAKELLAIMNHGLIINEGFVQVKINEFICDRPAKSFIKCVVSFNAYDGCIKCTVRGEFFKTERHMSFPQLDCPKRTDSEFRRKIHSDHQMKDIDGAFQISPLEELPIEIIKDIVVADSLHLLDLRVMKKCLTIWVNGSKTFKMKFFSNQISIISSWLLSCNNCLPKEIHRSVRQLDCLSFWKATEFRTFLLYLGPLILRDHLPREIYRHHLLLFCAVTLCSTDYYSDKLDLAEKLFRDYIEGFISIYGMDSISSNIHNLNHVVDDVKRFGSLCL
ncbi:unnamed protein product [Ceutorhynchus assimilis]|uniref:Uncharacterized protein n=1 Tax=Ceutorhynchus assimilis TaxID=467358 RepID=A0A9N9MX35_9CUCU|nr:unnamed protein product [Ceutorhynchus assimilis]